MATARELLQQADALMRRNRENGPVTEIPELTEMVGSEGENPDADGAVAFESKALPSIAVPQAFAQDPIVRDTTISRDPFPVLTEVIEADLEPPSMLGLPEDPPQEPGWPDEHGNVAAPVPVLVHAVPVPSALPSTEAAAWSPEGVVAPQHAPDGDAARWERLAEDVRMQVLQRIDIFTDTGLQERLTERLQPIVDRASADLVATINGQVGQLLRAYVAEAIEREIEKWRQGGAE